METQAYGGQEEDGDESEEYGATMAYQDPPAAAPDEDTVVQASAVANEQQGAEFASTQVATQAYTPPSPTGAAAVGAGQYYYRGLMLPVLLSCFLLFLLILLCFRTSCRQARSSSSSSARAAAAVKARRQREAEEEQEQARGQAQEADDSAMNSTQAYADDRGTAIAKEGVGADMAEMATQAYAGGSSGTCTTFIF